MYEFTDARAKGFDSQFHESERTARRTRDERELYGTACHEVDENCDERALYGEPQHETCEIPNLELLFVRMRAESATGPTVTAFEDLPSITAADQ